MVGSYGPKTEPHVFTTPVEDAPSGMMSRGHYTVKSKFTDDDKNIYLEWEWAFDIKKEWEWNSHHLLHRVCTRNCTIASLVLYNSFIEYLLQYLVHYTMTGDLLYLWLHLIVVLEREYAPEVHYELPRPLHSQGASKLSSWPLSSQKCWPLCGW